MSSTERGRQAEQAAAEYLEQHGLKILETNWRTRQCEIDIVATKNEIVYFVEVKYRAKETQGSGLEYVTPKKVTQMAYAAEMWVSYNDWQGEYQLAAIEVSGDDLTVTGFTNDIWV